MAGRAQKAMSGLTEVSTRDVLSAVKPIARPGPIRLVDDKRFGVIFSPAQGSAA